MALTFSRNSYMKRYTSIFFLVFFLSAPSIASNFSLQGIDFSLRQDSSESLGDAIQILLMLSVLSLAPALVVMITSFTRIIIVLAMLRQAFGMPSTPPNTVLISLAIFLTIFTMMPVISKIESEALVPYQEGKINAETAVTVGLAPLKEFMIRQTREKDLKTMADLAAEPAPQTIDDIKITVLVPAFMISELQTAFKIGFIIFIPFLLIDLIAASVLMAMGMIMVPPLTISLPIKILMFVLIDGWSLVAQSLINSFL